MGIPSILNPQDDFVIGMQTAYDCRVGWRSDKTEAGGQVEGLGRGTEGILSFAMKRPLSLAHV